MGTLLLYIDAIIVALLRIAVGCIARINTNGIRIELGSAREDVEMCFYVAEEGQLTSRSAGTAASPAVAAAFGVLETAGRRAETFS